MIYHILFQVPTLHLQGQSAPVSDNLKYLINILRITISQYWLAMYQHSPDHNQPEQPA